jgi:phospholipase/carboxylesterase
VCALTVSERPAAGEPEGLLILHHGRGTDERDLLGLGDALDPARRLLVVTPRAPLSLPGSPGYHWYVVPRVGYPDPETFHAALRQLSELHDELWQRTGIAPQRTVLGGFSMGAVMSYALGLAGGRPPPGGLLAFSGFVPTVEGWHPDLVARGGTRVFIAHGRRDPVIDVGFARHAARWLADGGLPVSYHESDVAHNIDPEQIAPGIAWLAETLPPAPVHEQGRA